jgi:hypothetical protein
MFRIPEFKVADYYFPITFQRPKLPWKPDGDIFLFEALEIFGENQFQSEWTGQELVARKPRPFPKDKGWGIKEIKLISSAPPPHVGV